MSGRVAIVIAVLLGTVTFARQIEPVEAEITLWTAAVIQHVPGTGDHWAKELAQWKWQRLKPLLTRLYKRRAIDTTLLLRATVMYGDIALFIPREDRPAYPALFPDDRGVTLAKDGLPVGETSRDSHLALAHELVRQVLKAREVSEHEKAVAAAWYVAVASVLARAHDLAGLRDHLEEAAPRFPQHAEIQFLSGCLAETIASPSVQAAMAVRDPPERRASLTRATDLLRQRYFARRANLDKAKQLYRKTLNIDGAHDEARIRLAQVLLTDGETKEALPLLEATPVADDPMLRYYRWLLLGRAYERVTRSDDARTAYESAARLFPNSQAPWLAMSALAASRGDLEGARTALNRITTDLDRREEPWWIYDECTGRNAKRLYTEFATRAQQLGRGSTTGFSR
jgi:tetratricopeptide (TPR) repeat protein